MTSKARVGPRIRYVAATLILITAGLVVRLVPLGLPIFIIRHAGNVIWGSMVLCLVAVIRPPRGTIGAEGGLASVIAIGTELFRLYHTPALDAFRLTFLGPLLIGRVFSVWNMLDYEIGIIIACCAIWIRGQTIGRSEPGRAGTWG